MTLDPLVRQVQLRDQRELLVSDTVGFIDRLPHALVAAFRATLEEVAEADLAAARDRCGEPRTRAPHGRGASCPRRSWRGGRAGHRRVQQDRCPQPEDERRRLQMADPAAALVSARTGEGVDELLEMVAARVALDTRRITITFDSGKEFDREQISRLYRVARVISHVATNGRSSSRPTCRDGSSNV